MIRPAVRARDDMVHREVPLAEMLPAAAAEALLSAVEAVQVRPVVGKVAKVRAARLVRPMDNRAVPVERHFVEDTMQAGCDKLGRFRGCCLPIHSRCRRSAATAAVAQPQNGSSTVSPSLLDARMIRSKSAKGFCVG